MANLTLFPASFAKSVATAISAASMGAKRAAGAAQVSASIGPAWRLRIRRSGSVVVDVVFQGAMPVVSGEIPIPAYSVLAQLGAVDLSLGGWTVRLGRVDETVYVEGALGGASSSAPFKLTSNISSGKGFAIGSLVLRFDAAIDGDVSRVIPLTAQQVLDELARPSDAPSVNWVAYVNQPAFVQFVGGNNAGKDLASVNLCGATVKGATNPLYWKDDGSVLAAYKDADLWTHITPLLVVGEEAALSNIATRVHSATNSAVYTRSQVAAGRRRSTGQWVIVRWRTDGQVWFRVSESLYLYSGDLAAGDLVSNAPEGGTKLRWRNADGFARHYVGYADGEPGFPVEGNGNRMSMGPLFNDVACWFTAVEIRVGPWDAALPWDASACRLIAHSGIDPHPTPTSTASDANQPAIMLSRQVRLSQQWQWVIGATIRDGAVCRQDHTHAVAADAGITAAEFLANPPPFLLSA
ncbi:MAG: hypothetical protein KBG29_02015 [Pseudomonadales bacterium]|nr:hypothetical protein [Pseudomonadales bacterium]